MSKKKMSPTWQVNKITLPDPNFHAPPPEYLTVRPLVDNSEVTKELRVWKSSQLTN